MTVRFPARATFPTPRETFDRYDESQFRAAIEQQFAGLEASMRTLTPVYPATLALSVLNETGSTIVRDKVVAVSGFDTATGLPNIVLADADVAAHDNLWVTTASILNNAAGIVYKGALSAANLDTSAAAAAGDPVYLSTTAGAFTATAPSGATSRVHPVGFVVVDHATTGQIQWLIGPVRKIARDELQSNTVTLGKANAFFSTEQTGTGSSQNIAHGMGATPSGVLIVPTELSAGLLGGYDVAEGAHDGTNVVVTVTSGEKFKVFAWA